MIYDFETLVSRKNTGSGKWDEMTKEHPNLPENVAPLSVADMELKNPPEIVEGLKKYIDTHILGYTGPTEEYFDAVCGWMKRRNDWDIKKEEIVSTHGVVTALAVSVLAYTDPGDGVITMPPVYYPFRMTIEHNNRKNVECPLINTNETYTIDFDLFEKLCAEEKNKMFIFCNPHNPVGRVGRKKKSQSSAPSAQSTTSSWSATRSTPTSSCRVISTWHLQTPARMYCRSILFAPRRARRLTLRRSRSRILLFPMKN